MFERDGLAERFESQRAHLSAVAYRMLGSRSEADDAVQETWLRLDRIEASTVQNVAGWLRATVTRICLDILRSRAARREEPADRHVFDQLSDSTPACRPEDEAVQADAVGIALLVVLNRLSPAERVAFVLHEMFRVPFAEIASIVERKPAAAKKLASRARGKVQGSPAIPADQLFQQRHVITAFLAATRARDLNAILATLDPNVVRRADALIVKAGAAPEIRGARDVAEGTVVLGGRAQFAELALVDGNVGVVVAPRGKLLLALTFVVQGDRIAAYDVIADPARLQRMGIGIFA